MPSPSALPVIDALAHARSRLDRGPLSARTLRAVELLRSASPQERIVDSACTFVANLVVNGRLASDIRFCEVTTEDDWRQVRELRLRCYPRLLPYLLGVLEPDGSDRHDRHSFVYAAFLGDRAVATIRATSYPFETLDHLEETALGAFLGEGWKSDYIEWGRLLVDPLASKLRLAPALITYAGLRLMALTPYRCYFGYTKPGVRHLISRFAIDGSTFRFQIPSRGSHEYLLTKGSLGTTAVSEVPRWIRRVRARFVRGIELHSPSSEASSTCPRQSIPTSTPR